MPSDSNKNMDTYLSSGVATDIGTSQLKEMDDFHKKRIAEGKVGPNPGASGPDALERSIARFYFGISRRFFFGLALAGAILGFLASTVGSLQVDDVPPYAVAGLGAVAGYAIIPGLYLAIRLGYLALKLALGFAILYLVWRFLILPWMEGTGSF